MIAFWFALMCLAAFRITRFITTDNFPPVEALRKRWVNHWGIDSSWSYLAECPWCAGSYITAATVLVMMQFASIPLPVLQGIAIGGIVGLLGQVDTKLDG